MAEQDTDEKETPERPAWFDEIRPGNNGRGFFEHHLRHSLVFVERPVNRLLVTFDNLSNVNDNSPLREPWAYKFAREINVSHLGIMAHVANWYRDEDLIERFQRLSEDGFFEGYDRVIFAGVSMGGYAAIAFGSMVPGSHVVTINPQSTLDTELVPWETRYLNGRRQDWTLPLSDASELTGNLGRVNVFYDPYHDLDKKHVARFSGENIHIYNCRYSSHKTAVFLRKIGALKPVMHHAIFDELVPLEFYKLYRGRRDLRWFKGSVSAYFNERGRDEVAERFGVAFRKRYRKMARQKAQQEQSAGIDDAISDAPPPVADESGKKEVKSPPLAVDLPARKNDSCLMVTTMKNEGPFMLEWVAYNRSIGFTDFLIYTNHCDDGTDKIANRLEEIGVAHHINNKFKKGMSPQRAALRKALKHDAYNRADWAICADCDEFLNIRAGDGKLPDLFDALGETDAISFCWKIFGCGDQVEYRDQFVTEQFTWSAPEQYRDKYRALGLKTMFRPGRGTTRFGVHRPKFDNGQPEGFIWKDASGNLVPDQLFSTGWSAWNGFGNDLARLHHYSVRSVDSFLVKRDRGRTNHVDRDQGLTYWADMNLNIEEDKSIVPRVKDMREEFEALLTDEKLSRLHAESCSWHAGKIASLKSNEVWALFHKQLQEINRTGQDPKECIELLKEFAAE